MTFRSSTVRAVRRQANTSPGERIRREKTRERHPVVEFLRFEVKHDYPAPPADGLMPRAWPAV
jgi:hypothetical protein